MPGSILDVDTSFPEIRGKGQDDINREVLDYLFMLLEQLKYTLANLGRENFNDTEFDGIVTYIQTPLYVALEDTNGHVTKLEVRADGLDLSVADLYGNVTRLDARADGLVASVSDLDGNLSKLSMTVYGMRLEVSNGYSSSSITLTADGVGISSQVISFNGTVTFTDLAGEGTTTINGANIKTGTIKAIQIEGCDFTTILMADGSVSGRFNFCYLDRANLAGGLRLDSQGEGTDEEGRYRLYLYTRNVGGRYFNLKLESENSISVQCAKDLYLISDEGEVHIEGKTKIALYSPGELSVNTEKTVFKNTQVFIGEIKLDSYIWYTMEEKTSELDGKITALEGEVSSLSGRVEGLYNEGYSRGYSAGESAGYDSGYSSGYSSGYDAGYSAGQSAGGGK